MCRLLGDRARQRGVFQQKAVEQLVLKEQNFGRQVWGLLSLELWFRAFVDGDQIPRFTEEPAADSVVGASS